MQLSENIKMTNFHLTFLWIFPYNMGNNDRKGADPGMRKVDHNKQQKKGIPAGFRFLSLYRQWIQ